MPVPNHEPERITAGETVQWTRSAPAGVPDGATLKYALQSFNNVLITVAASTVEGGFAVNIDAATSATFAPGVYFWTAYLESGDPIVRTGVARGTITILASLLGALNATHAMRTLALIEAALEGRVPNGLQSTEIDGQRLDRIPIADLYRLRQKYKQEVMNERLVARAERGLPTRRTLSVRFINPSSPSQPNGIPHSL